ncbi:NAD(P)-binding protein [Armillaria solidipes]|uniref:NAD(P)-binding protein n=1 Tax=Armillaria solidipes TaxID=1076256 RepID=A0A2H3ALQ2_9AGAR|nr:NAD(P)-binding protein [Armillaria solidipes]
MKLYTSGVAFTTGAGQGIGKATALSFAESGIRGLVLAGRTSAPFTRPPSNAEPSLRILTMGTKTKFSSIPTEDWLAIQQTNINGIFWLVREQISVMEKQERLVTPITSPKRPAERGSIVVLSAAAAVIALPDGGAYTHTKYATNGLTKAAAQDHASNGIRINAILPGYIYIEGLAPRCHSRGCEAHRRWVPTRSLRRGRRNWGSYRHDEFSEERVHDREQRLGRWTCGTKGSRADASQINGGFISVESELVIYCGDTIVLRMPFVLYGRVSRPR